MRRAPGRDFLQWAIGIILILCLCHCLEICWQYNSPGKPNEYFLSCVFLHRIATFGQWKMQYWLSVTGRRESRLATGQRQWVATSETSGKWPLARLGWSSLRLEFSLCGRQATISKEWAWKCFCESTSVHHWSEDWRWKRQRSSWGRRLAPGEQGRSWKIAPCPSTGFSDSHLSKVALVLLRKHRKNCECCPVSQLIVR